MLYIRRENYGAKKGSFTGEVKFENEDGSSFEFKLTAKQSALILDVIRDAVVQSAAELGEKLAISILPPSANSTTNPS